MPGRVPTESLPSDRSGESESTMRAGAAQFLENPWDVLVNAPLLCVRSDFFL